MFVRQLLEVQPADTVLHRLDARTKISGAMIVCLISILLDTPVTLYAVLLFLLSLHLWAKTSVEKWAVLMFIMMAGVWGSVISQALFYAQEPRTPILCILAYDTTRPFFSEGLYLYKEGMIYGALQAMRSSIMLSAGMLVCWTTDTRDLLRSLLYWQVPYPLAFMTISSLRFLPDIVSETMTVITAQRLRGFCPKRSLRMGKVIQMFYRILFPVLARTIRRAATLSLSVESRGFGRTAAHPPAMKRWHIGRIFICVAWAAFGVLTTVKIAYWLQFGGIWYSPALRSVYDFAKFWM